MSNTVISVENLSKVYRLGQIGTGTFTNDMKVWLARARGKPNPLLKIGQTDHGNRAGEEIWALKDVNFTVEQGEVLGIIGRNGAGKSTLLKILSRVTAPTSGRIRVKGRIASLLEVGTGFHPELTGRENVYLNGAIMGMTRADVDHKFDEIVDFAGVEQFIDTPVKRYSSGMHVRLGFAVAAHLESEILLVDEVLAVGDAEFQKKCLGKMGDVASKEGRTVLFVSHNMTAVQNLCSRGILLDKGNINQDSTIIDVISVYVESMSERNRIEISKRDDRKGVGRVRFTHIEYYNEYGEKVNSAISGELLIIRLYYEVNSVEIFRNVRFSVKIEKNGFTYFVVSTEMVQRKEINILKSSWIECKILKLPLAVGIYQLTIFCETGKEIQDWLENSETLTVGMGDFFGTGRDAPLGLEGKFVLVSHEWTQCEE